MIKVNIYYHVFHRNDGPPFYYLHNLKKLKNIEVQHLKPDGDISRFGKADLHLWVDYGEDALPVDQSWEIPNDGGIKAYVCSDAHWNTNSFKFRVEKAKKFDYVFLNQKEFIEPFKAEGIKNPIFLPHAGEPDAYYPHEIVKKYDVCFIGHVQEQDNGLGFSRVDALDRLFKEFPNFYYGSLSPQAPQANLFEDAAKKYCQSKIVLNVAAKCEINMRAFETNLTKSFQLCSYVPNMGEVFEDGKELVMYKTLDEMIEKAHYYLEHEEEREKIAEAGYKKALQETYMHRVKKVLSLIFPKEEF